MAKNFKLITGILSLIILVSLLFPSLTQTSTPFQRDTTRGNDSFDLTEKEVARRVNAVEPLIAECMAENGFEYYPVDYAIIRAALDFIDSINIEIRFTTLSLSYGTVVAIKENVSDFKERFGYGISTFYGQEDQITSAEGDRNMEYYKSLPETDQIAYDQVLYGEDKGATFLMALDNESFVRTGGCLKKAAEQIFSPEEVSAVNFQTDLESRVENDKRVLAAYKEWSKCLLDAGYVFEKQDDIPTYLMTRLEEVTGNQPLSELSNTQLAELEELQSEEVDLAVVDIECEEEYLEETRDEVEEELYLELR